MDTDPGALRHLAERPKEHPPIVVVVHDGLPAITASLDTGPTIVEGDDGWQIAPG